MHIVIPALTFMLSVSRGQQLPQSAKYGMPPIGRQVLSKWMGGASITDSNRHAGSNDAGKPIRVFASLVLAYSPAAAFNVPSPQTCPDLSNSLIRTASPCQDRAGRRVLNMLANLDAEKGGEHLEASGEDDWEADGEDDWEDDEEEDWDDWTPADRRKKSNTEGSGEVADLVEPYEYRSNLVKDEVHWRKVWYSVKKPLLSIGIGGVTQSHQSHLSNLLKTRPVVKVKMIKERNIARNIQALEEGSDAVFFAARGALVLFGRDESSLADTKQEEVASKDTEASEVAENEVADEEKDQVKMSARDKVNEILKKNRRKIKKA
mmetsp:Transcript_56497/g.103644  ORF Transcript_56497/g.103644 Transcript_56497/m.103644 type:complete len:320 (-) Transcript_56497:2-961(-)